MRADSRRVHRICIFRHGETDWNAEGRFQGHIDVPLNEKGRQQARALVPALRSARIEAILASDLIRAHETARIIGEDLGVPVFTHEGLREAHLGGAQGMTLVQIEEKFGSAMTSRWRSSHPTDADVAYPGGETGTEVRRRSISSLEEFLGSSPFLRIGVATHGGVIRRIMQSIRPPGSGPVPIPNGVMYELEFEAALRLWRVVGL